MVNKKKSKKKYIAPKMYVLFISCEEGFAAASIQPGVVGGEYRVEETWQDDTIDRGVDWYL